VARRRLNRNFEETEDYPFDHVDFAFAGST